MRFDAVRLGRLDDREQIGARDGTLDGVGIGTAVTTRALQLRERRGIWGEFMRAKVSVTAQVQ